MYTLILQCNLVELGVVTGKEDQLHKVCSLKFLDYLHNEGVENDCCSIAIFRLGLHSTFNKCFYTFILGKY